ncbi:peptide-methionine (S)-S-oxide reductase MsrA [Sphingomonadaceae bacterium G21617-S1]|uniref:peptide-methionine (S)-S-oxide reductase MsrA n=1 Tax=Rhizorhabdus sp. TaxID=1968843 RepID=UPI0022C0899D|nr:peptide-methionine (S)-S-oxide reductase MsrA [Rhizorhabdus sp.]MCZ4342171.1 peptide-methionine (S)-S-oxide reductase MsrA [Sphingomonadaceae bacterium G21617-S1]
MTDTPNRPLIAGISAGLLLLAAAGTMATRSPAVAPAPRVEPGPIARAPAAAKDPAEPGQTATAIFAGGCFWGVQGVYQHVDGVKSAVSGYSGGNAQSADYETVGTGSTGHAEAVKVTYDPRRVSYGTLLRIFFAVVADPTTLNRQGPDRGTQYRTAIFPTTPQQKVVAEAYVAQLGAAKLWKAPIVTKVERYRGFYPAEKYHQDFLVRKPDYPYIVYNDLPKVEALRVAFPNHYRKQAVTVYPVG